MKNMYLFSPSPIFYGGSTPKGGWGQSIVLPRVELLPPSSAKWRPLPPQVGEGENEEYKQY